MVKKRMTRLLSLLLSVLMLAGSVVGLVSCDTGSQTDKSTEVSTSSSTSAPTSAETSATTEPPATEGQATDIDTIAPSGDTDAEPVTDDEPVTELETEPETETSSPIENEPDPSEDVDYGERAFRILTSTNAASAGMGNSNFLIEGEKDAVTSLVNDAVATRNAVVEQKLNITLEFTQLDVDYNGVATKIENYTNAGTDEFDLVINDLFPFANLSIKGVFRNILDAEFTGFDFENKSYWYQDYMDDMCLVSGYEYLLAGDYFIDILRSAHLLLFNKDMYTMLHENADANEVYEWVLNYEWTYEKMLEMIQGAYQDKNGNGEKDYGDIYGYAILELWGSSIGLVVSAAPGFVTRDKNGELTITLGEGNRAADLTDYLTKLAYDDNACFGLTSDSQVLQDFTDGLSLIGDYQRLGSLENAVLKGMAGSFGVLPCPMLYASDRQYNTATHDTTEVGAILQTSKGSKFISTVIQVLNRETAIELMPKYYEEALQIQYVTDPYASQMVQIIHDNIRESFILAYNNYLGSTILNVFSNAVQEQRTFEVKYKSLDKNSGKAMTKMLKSFKKKNHID